MELILAVLQEVIANYLFCGVVVGVAADCEVVVSCAGLIPGVAG